MRSVSIALIARYWRAKQAKPAVAEASVATLARR